MVVVMILTSLVLIVALVCVFGVQKRSDTYHVNKGSTWLPLMSRRPNETLGEEPS